MKFLKINVIVLKINVLHTLTKWPVWDLQPVPARSMKLISIKCSLVLGWVQRCSWTFSSPRNFSAAGPFPSSSDV